MAETAPEAPPPPSAGAKLLRLCGAVAIGATGLALAWPFRHLPAPGQPVQERVETPVQLVAPTDSAQVAFQAPGQTPLPSPAPLRPLTRQVASQEAARLPTVHPVERNVPPPELAPRYTPTDNAPNTLIEVRPDSAERPREHRLVDGDTLRRIAQRYLGDANRWPEIQAANPTLLANPEVVPIGKIIRLPLRSTLPESNLAP